MRVIYTPKGMLKKDGVRVTYKKYGISLLELERNFTGRLDRDLCVTGRYRSQGRQTA
jgi:hypothetical protein